MRLWELPPKSTVRQSYPCPPCSPGPSSPESVVRSRPFPQTLDEKELMSQLRQVSRAKRCG